MPPHRTGSVEALRPATLPRRAARHTQQPCCCGPRQDEGDAAKPSVILRRGNREERPHALVGQAHEFRVLLLRQACWCIRHADGRPLFHVRIEVRAAPYEDRDVRCAPRHGHRAHVREPHRVAHPTHLHSPVQRERDRVGLPESSWPTSARDAPPGLVRELGYQGRDVGRVCPPRSRRRRAVTSHSPCGRCFHSPSTRGATSPRTRFPASGCRRSRAATRRRRRACTPRTRCSSGRRPWSSIADSRRASSPAKGCARPSSPRLSGATSTSSADACASTRTRPTTLERGRSHRTSCARSPGGRRGTPERRTISCWVSTFTRRHAGGALRALGLADADPAPRPRRDLRHGVAGQRRERAASNRPHRP